MKPQNIFSSVAHFMRKLLLIDLGLLIVTGLVSWLGGWRTIPSYGFGLVIAGAAAMAFGALSLSGAATITGDWRYRYSQSVMPNTLTRGRNRTCLICPKVLISSSSWALPES